MLVNKYFISAILKSDNSYETIKKEFKKVDPSIKIESEEIDIILTNDVIKRELIDTPEAIEAKDKYQKALRKIEKQKNKAKENDNLENKEKDVTKNEAELK